jgi:hypothetical protein
VAILDAIHDPFLDVTNRSIAQTPGMIEAHLLERFLSLWVRYLEKSTRP